MDLVDMLEDKFDKHYFEPTGSQHQFQPWVEKLAHCGCAGMHKLEFTMICDPPQNWVNFPSTNEI